ncbi:MAG: three-Cys-motif partner protein TcmP [Bacteroides xylanisolvens]
MSVDINKTAFDEKTLLKLEFFREYFKEWLPVFIFNNYKKLYVYDFFAGSGVDMNGVFGSPLVLLNEMAANNGSYCGQLMAKEKNVTFVFNEVLKDKYEELCENTNNYISECQNRCHRKRCVIEKYCINWDFKDLFEHRRVQSILANPNYAKFILLDQYGFKLVDESVFRLLVDSPTTDFIFFVSTSFIARFKSCDCVKTFLNNNSLDLDNTKPKECHRVLAKYFRTLIPDNKEFYLHHFTIKKKTNYYGLIYGTSHSYGMEKFLNICWRKDPLSGESDCNVFDDYPVGTLFHEANHTIKIETVKNEIEKRILSGEISNNIDGFKFTLNSGCLPKLFTEVVKKLKKEKLIDRGGNPNYQSTQIHKVGVYNIVLKK